MLRLRVVSSSEPTLVGRTFAIVADRIRIGRGPDNEIVLDDAGLSRHHATLTRTPNGWTLSDDGSANGLWVGEVSVGSAVLGPETQVRIGGTVLALEDSGAAATIILDPQARPLAPGPSPILALPNLAPPRIAPQPATPGSSSSIALLMVGLFAALLLAGGIAVVVLVPGLSERITGLFGSAPSSAPATTDSIEPLPTKPAKPSKPMVPQPAPTGTAVPAPALLALVNVREAREAKIDGVAGGELVLSNGARLTIGTGAFVGEQTVELVRTAARGLARAHGFLGDVYLVAAQNHALPSKFPRLEIPIDRSAFPEHTGPFAAYAVHADGLPYRVAATMNAERDVMVIERPAVHVLMAAAGRDFDEPPPNSGSNSNSNSNAGSGANSGSNSNSTAYTTAPADKVPKIECGKVGSIVEEPTHVFRIHAGADMACAHMKAVSEILQEAYVVYQREYKTAAGKSPFEGWLSAAERMEVTVSAMVADFPEGKYSPWWGGGSMTLASSTAAPNPLHAHELRVTLYHELFHTLQDMYSAMIVSKLADRMWWIEATAEWAGRRYSRGLTQPTAMQDMVTNAFREGHGTPYVLRFPIDESRSWKDGNASYHYAMLVEFIENQSPGYVRKALQSGDIRGESLLKSMYVAGKLDTTYAQFVTDVRTLAGGRMPLDGKIMETPKQTRVWRRTGTTHDSMLDETPKIETEFDARYTNHRFSAVMAPATARLFYIKAASDAKPDVALNLAVATGGAFVDHALLITASETKRINANYNNSIENIRTVGDVWLLVFRPYLSGEWRSNDTYDISISLYLDCPRPGGVIMGGRGGTRKTKETILHEECYARNGYHQVEQEDGTLKWVEIAAAQ